MQDIPESLRLFFETSIEERDGEYLISIPKEVLETSTGTVDDVYRVALFDGSQGDQRRTGKQSQSDSQQTPVNSTGDKETATPPVEEGETRSVSIDTLGDQGDGIARVERGFIVIVPGTKPGDQVEVEVTDVKDSVAFAEPISEAEVR